jgi:pyruvate/2-oxoglutarate dehydrogenase complex dihydrolipoamide dehydrogenase (E3) component
MTERYDAIIVGMGPGGEVVAGRLLAAGREVAVVEKELIGGECAYWACIPSKTLLRPTEAQHEAARAAGTGSPQIDWPALRDYRDFMVRDLDDSGQIRSYQDQGATVVKGTAALAGPGRVDVEGRLLEADHVILATGSDPVRPPIEGLETVEAWTNRQATTLREIPARVVVVGGSAVGVELGQFLARMGSQVTLVQRADRLVDREEPRVGELARTALVAVDGIDVRTGRQVTSVRSTGEGTAAELDDGSQVACDVVLLATGRTPATGGLGLDTVGVTPDRSGALPVDQRCQVAKGLWGVGDVTGVALFTHVAMYQGRVVADNILGKQRSAHYDGVPRVIFADPEIATAGLTSAQARDRGIDVALAEIDLAESLARPWTYQQDPTGTLGLLVDREQRLLVGAYAVSPLAGEWIQQAALAIRARVPLDVLLDQVAQFPTFSEGYLKALEQLEL